MTTLFDLPPWLHRKALTILSTPEYRSVEDRVIKGFNDRGFGGWGDHLVAGQRIRRGLPLRTNPQYDVNGPWCPVHW